MSRKDVKKYKKIIQEKIKRGLQPISPWKLEQGKEPKQAWADGVEHYMGLMWNLHICTYYTIHFLICCLLTNHCLRFQYIKNRIIIV